VANSFGTEPMALLYGDLDLRDASQVVDQLARSHIQYRIAGNGSQVMVQASRP
jgi:flagellar M-ring protein FliF